MSVWPVDGGGRVPRGCCWCGPAGDLDLRAEVHTGFFALASSSCIASCHMRCGGEVCGLKNGRKEEGSKRFPIALGNT